jgi:hypothetical protein
MVAGRFARHGYLMTSEYPITGLERFAPPVVHVAPVGRTAKWRVHDGDPAEPVSEHASSTAAEAAAHSRARERGADRIVMHDRYHRTRLIDSEAQPSDGGSLRPTIDQMSEWSFPASDPPATWTWDP